ncbi:MAG TPA: glycosyltransferase family 2 protein [Chloroflexota bacterium]|nr:glycosyltransferase family 2 protein [Chloroflexota bacterium]
MIWPTVSIVVTTYNGRRQLAPCLAALAALDYPTDRYQIVVVDNASTDDTRAFVTRHFPRVRVVHNAHNLGFAAGSNLGFAAAPADFFVTLNDDTVVAPDWLCELIRPALDDPRVGLTTGKLIFMRNRLRVAISQLPGGPCQQIVQRTAWLDDQATVVEVLGPPVARHCQLGVAVEVDYRPRLLRLELVAPAGHQLLVSVDDGPYHPATVGSGGTLVVPMPSDVPIWPVIQNAGSLVFRDGRGRDRGAIVGPGFHYYAEDRGQFDQTEEVFAGCGASLLIRASLLADVGAFDERFFMYYEDTDLSWRARLRGWKVVYAAKAVVRHAHRTSTAGWTDRFVYYTERNRLFMLLKLTRARRAFWQVGRATVAAGIASLAAARRAGRGMDPSRAWAMPRWAALGDLARHWAEIAASRAKIRAGQTVSDDEIDRWLE